MPVLEMNSELNNSDDCEELDLMTTTKADLLMSTTSSVSISISSDVTDPKLYSSKEKRSSTVHFIIDDLDK
jgi:hypothetical protein